MDKQRLYRQIPKVDIILEDKRAGKWIENYGRNSVVAAVREGTEALRELINSSGDETECMVQIEHVMDNIECRLKTMCEYHVKKVINATGTILHTNLGRAPISEQMAERLKMLVSGYSNLEYDLKKGVRGERYSHFEELLCRLTGAEAAIAVNNNAAAVLLILSTLTKGKQAVVSRGELVEVGGAFRIPAVMEQSGTTLVEVGATNKTRLSDYEAAITDETAALLKVHTSNYRIIGFSESVPIRELAQLGASKNIPVIEDLGSGVLIDLSKYGIQYEPTVQDSLSNGADIVCFSGDKLLGGPQAGIIVGKKAYIDRMKKNPLMRAVRIDKFTAFTLEMVLHEYLEEKDAVAHIPTLHMMTMGLETLFDHAKRLLERLEDAGGDAAFEMAKCTSMIGGGSLPTEELESCGVTIEPNCITSAELERKLRYLEVPVVVRVIEGKVLLDIRTVFLNDFDLLVSEITHVLNGEI